MLGVVFGALFAAVPLACRLGLRGYSLITSQRLPASLPLELSFQYRRTSVSSTFLKSYCEMKLVGYEKYLVVVRQVDAGEHRPDLLGAAGPIFETLFDFTWSSPQRRNQDCTDRWLEDPHTIDG